MFIDGSPNKDKSHVEVLKFIVALCFLVISIPLCFGQSDSPKTPPTALVNVNEVSLDMIVRDKRGRLVSDLKPEELAVTDGGTAVKLSSLRLVSGGGGDRFVTIVFDRMDSSAGHNARDIAAKILKMTPEDGFSFCVMKAETRLMLYQDFTSDRAALTNAIAQAVSVDESASANGAVEAEKRLIAMAKAGNDHAGNQVTASQRTAAQAVLSALQESRRVLEELHTQPGIAGLIALARAEQRIPRRKTVIYFTPGLREDSTSEQRLGDIVGSANRAGVSIYVINTNALTAQADQGMLAMMAMGNARAAAAQTPAQPAFTTGEGGVRTAVPQPPPGLAPMVSNQMDRYELADQNANKSPLVSLAEATGGTYVGSGENINKPLRRMIADMTTYYEAAYVPPVENFDGQFRPIAVKSLRAGLRISSRAGYFALSPDLGQGIRPFEAPLLKILDDGPMPTDVEFHTKVLELGEMATGNENTILVEVPISALKTQDDPNSNLYSLHVALVVRIKNKAGAVIEHFGEDIPRHGALDKKDAAQAGTIIVQRHFTADPGEYLLEAAVFDHNGGKTGAQRLTFNIPSSSTGPYLSDIAMVQRIDPVPEEADPTEPMRYGSGKIVPSAMERVEKGSKQLSFFFVVHPDADSTEQPSLEMEILKSGEPVTQVPLALRKTNGLGAVPYLASIQAAGLPSGDYEVVERLSQGGRTAMRSLAFRIAGTDGSAESGATHGATKADAEALGALPLPQTDGPSGHSLKITSLPSTEGSAPAPDQLEAIISQARKRAVDYSKALPNFMCIEVTNRSVDQAGNGNWKQRDSIAELLTYHDNAETRSTLQVNGVRSSLKRTEMNSTWPLSVGEFGAVLNLVFKPSSKTVFEWKEAATLGDGTGTVQVLSYRVTHENATIVLTHGNDQVGVGFHGLVYIDVTTGGVRRVTLQADGLPHSFAFHAAAITVDYDYVAISGRDYLMPVRSTVSVQRGRRQIELNEISFRNYRRFASRTKIKVLQ